MLELVIGLAAWALLEEEERHVDAQERAPDPAPERGRGPGRKGRESPTADAP